MALLFLNTPLDLSAFEISRAAFSHAFMDYGYNPADRNFNLGLETEFYFSTLDFSLTPRVPTGAYYGGSDLDYDPATDSYLGTWNRAFFYEGFFYEDGSNPLLLEIYDANVPADAFLKALYSPNYEDDIVQRNLLLAGDDSIVGSTGDDVLYAGNGRNYVFGQPDVAGVVDRDTLVVDHLKNESEFLFFDTGNVVITDRTVPANANGTMMINIEAVRFEDGSEFALDQFSNAGRLSNAQWVELSEMYVAYFNRAADAEGLMFWADKYFEGLSLEAIAEFFFDQPETRALYPNADDTDAFVTAVYNNVLGRIPDQEGYDFWVSVLETGLVSQGAFVLAIINGAKAETGSVLDAQYLSEKAELGLYFSAFRGMSDVNDAIDIMLTYGSADERDLSGAIAAINGHHADAMADASQLLIVGPTGLTDIFDDRFFLA